MLPLPYVIQAVEADSDQIGTVLDVIKAARAGEALQEITTAVTTISDMNRHIASAAEEQNSVAEEINRNIVNINQLADSSVETSEQISSAGNNLESLAVELQQLVGEFKT